MNALDLLKTQHQEVKALLKKVVETSGAEGSKLLEEITHNLLGHMIIEQEIFYPAAAKADLPDIDEGYEEHYVAREMINRAMQTVHDKVLFQARCKVLKELIEHHVEEEEDNMFPKVKKGLGDDAIEALGAKMDARFKQLKISGLAALARRADEVEVLADARNGGKKTTSKKTAKKKTAKRSAPAVRRGAGARQAKAR